MLQKIKDYISTRLLLLKVEATEKISEALSVLFKRIILLMVAGSFFFFISIAIALWIGKTYSSNITGFLVIAAIYFLIFIILIIFRKQLLEKNIKNEIIRKVFQDSDNQK